MKTINVPTVPLKEAVAGVTRFREQLVAQVPATNIPRAILIPIQDLLAIVDKFSVVDEEGNTKTNLEGVRAYFTVKVTDKMLPDDVTAYIVPVDKNGNDIITATNGGVKGDDDTDIYDFTKPCPDQCDPDSPLYVDVP